MRFGRLAAGLVAGMLVTVVVESAGAQSAGHSGTATANQSAQAQQTGLRSAGRTVTLVTGDRVIARPGPGGGYAVEARPGPGRDGTPFKVLRTPREHLVIPLDAAGLVASGTVDRRLFDINLLMRYQLDDARTKALPLLLNYRDGRTPRSAPPGTRMHRALPVVDAVAVRQPRRTAHEFWQRLVKEKQIAKVWLDGGVRPLLDRSAAQIGAPAAWQSGVTGRGVKVAVLDTGYDPEHPDLKDAVVAAQDFSDSGDTVDRVGHGTHVASTVAGSGAASQGRRKGVAPDADLLIGKVCASSRCELSAIIAGMQWAVDQGARVVNLSLGGGPSDGTDPLAVAVNQLTERTGALFVVAAGNDGYANAEQLVGTPASADHALAVASVTKADTVSPFSSRGPRFGDLALKPDIAAPGSRIVAARAAGTLENWAVDESYAELSGTSMATPHVAGAAAIMAQRHPSWKAAELRAALTGSAARLDGAGVFDQGAGRVDLARAITQQVHSQPAAVNLGTAVFPHHDDPVTTKTIAYRNDSDRPVRLALELGITGPDRKPAATGMFRLGANTLTVPAHGTASTTVIADTRLTGPDGGYGGWLTARSGNTAVRTAVGINKEVPSHDLNVRMLDRNGKPARDEPEGNTVAVVFAFSQDTGWGLFRELPEGTGTLRLPRGSYVMDGLLGIGNEGTDGYREAILFGEPRLRLDHDLDLVMDARQANLVRTKPPVANATLASASVGYITPFRGSRMNGAMTVIHPHRPGATLELYATPSRAGVDRATTWFAEANWARLPENPKPDREFYLNSPYLYRDLAYWPGALPDRPTLATPPSGYARVDATYPSATPGTRINKYGFPTIALPGFDRPVAAYNFVSTVEAEAPVRRAEYYAAPPGVRWSFHQEAYRFVDETTPEIIIDSIVRGPATRYLPGRTYHERWGAPVVGPNLPTTDVGQPASIALPPWVGRDGDSLTVNAPMFADAGPDRAGEAAIESERTTLHRDGTLIGESDAVILQTFTMPADQASYRLTKDIARPADQYRTSTRISSAWTFRSERTPDGAEAALPLLNIRYLPMLDDHNRAPTGRFELPIRVEPQAGSKTGPIRRLMVEASYDDGKTWHRLEVRRTGGHWTATLTHPGPGFVTLRGTTTDTHGNNTVQTITRAYEVR